MEALPTDTTVLLRRGNKNQPGPLEAAIALAAETWWWYEVEWMVPNPDAGREATFLRDCDMVSKADLVIAFFDPDEMTGGTAHVVEQAIASDKPVYAWGVKDGRGYVRLGEWDPDDAWADLINLVCTDLHPG